MGGINHQKWLVYDFAIPTLVFPGRSLADILVNQGTTLSHIGLTVLLQSCMNLPQQRLTFRHCVSRGRSTWRQRRAGGGRKGMEMAGDSADGMFLDIIWYNHTTHILVPWATFLLSSYVSVKGINESGRKPVMRVGSPWPWDFHIVLKTATTG